jgi:hypothetical protein
MSAIPANQIGYQIVQNSIPSAMWQNNCLNTVVPITSITGLSPTGSVWIIQYNLDFWVSFVANVYRVQHGAYNGSTLLTAAGGNYQTNAIGGNYYWGNGPMMNANTSYFGTGVIVSDSTQTVTVSCYFQGTAVGGQTGSVKAQSAYITATRIA